MARGEPKDVIFLRGMLPYSKALMRIWKEKNLQPVELARRLVVATCEAYDRTGQLPPLISSDPQDTQDALLAKLLGLDLQTYKQLSPKDRILRLVGNCPPETLAAAAEDASDDYGKSDTTDAEARSAAAKIHQAEKSAAHQSAEYRPAAKKKRHS